MKKRFTEDALANYYASDVIKQSDNDFYKFYGQIGLAGAGGGLSAGGIPFLAAANAARGAGTVGSLLEYGLATRLGAGVTSGVVNATSQLIQGEPFRWTNVGIAVASGALGTGGGLAWNTAIGASGGFVQTEMNNWIYGENKNVFLETVTSAATGGIGYWVGDKTTHALGGQWPNSIIPIISGNVAGSTASEGASAGIDKLGNKNKDGSAAK